MATAQEPSRRLVVVVTGPTASGKTSLSLDLARRLDGEVISADSVQVYRGLDVGSAKLPLADRQGVPHHLLDVRDPFARDDYSAGDFFHDARAATLDVLDRGKTAIVVGGTGMYLRWFLHGKPDTPVSTPETSAAARAAIDAACASAPEGDDVARWALATECVAAAGDVDAGKRLARNDYYRLTRAMEIVQCGGLPRAAFAAPSKSVPPEKSEDAAALERTTFTEGGSVPSAAPLAEALGCEVRSYAVSMRPRDALYRQINGRVEDMVAGGLLDEAASMLDAGAVPESCCGSRAIGYREAIALLHGAAEKASLGDTGEALCTASDVRQTVFDIQRATRNFAKRQLTWLRNDASFEWLDATRGSAAMADAVEKSLRGEKSDVLGAEGVWNGALSKVEERAMRTFSSELLSFKDGDEGDRVGVCVAWVERWALERAKAKKARVS